MIWLDWKKAKWRQRFFAILTLLFVVSLMAHPELRLLAPLIDALGVDVLIALMSAQFLTFLSESVRPHLVLWWHSTSPLRQLTERFIVGTRAPLHLRRLFCDLVFQCSGRTGHLWVRLYGLIATAWHSQGGPNNSFKPKPLRGSA